MAPLETVKERVGTAEQPPGPPTVTKSSKRDRDHDTRYGARGRAARRKVRASNVLRAVGHESRRRILRALHEADGPRSCKDLAAPLGKEIGHLAYHYKVLKECGTVEMTGSRPARGALERFYISIVRDNELVALSLKATAEEDQDVRES